MALHELATNASKYGALSAKGGAVRIRWRLEADQLEIEWVEQGGPPVEHPTRMGFGSKVIEASIAEQLNGSVQADWRATGLHCVLRVPDAHEIAEPAADAHDVREDAGGAALAAAGAVLSRARILIVEDEALIALMMVDSVEQEGATVIGPFNTLEDALACEDVPDVALLDVNLAGVSSYPLADKLRARNCPIVFATGYDESSVAPEFAGAPVLQKPIEPEILIQALANLVRSAASAGRETAPADARHA
jgi:CheY-like chemotaxis protein